MIAPLTGRFTVTKDSISVRLARGAHSFSTLLCIRSVARLIFSSTDLKISSPVYVHLMWVPFPFFVLVLAQWFQKNHRDSVYQIQFRHSLTQKSLVGTEIMIFSCRLGFGYIELRIQQRV